MTSSYLETLFYKHYAGACTEQEEAELMELIRQSANDGELKLLFEKIWDDPATGVPFPAQSADVIFSAILETGVMDKKILRLPARRRFAWLVAAASVMAIIAVSILLLIRTRSANPKEMSTRLSGQHDVKPGGNRAILTLGDGSEIVLDSAADGAITLQGNTKVIKSGSGQLAYNKSITQESNPVKALFNTLTIPRGGQYQLTLPDGTKVWLNAVSSLRYPTAFAGNERRVELTGEAYFEVAKNSHAPFRVQAGSMQVDVLGTGFNVMAYPEEQQVRTTLVEGAVNVLNDKTSVLLQPGQQARLSQRGLLTVTGHPDMEEELAWKNGDFRFKNSNITLIMRSLARWYDVDVTYDSKPVDLFNVDIPRNVSLSEVLKLLELTNSVHFQIDGKKVTVRP